MFRPSDLSYRTRIAFVITPRNRSCVVGSKRSVIGSSIKLIWALVLSTLLVSPSFERVVKKMHAKDKRAVDTVVTAVAENPAIGEE